MCTGKNFSRVTMFIKLKVMQYLLTV